MKVSVITTVLILCSTTAACGVYVAPGPTELPIKVYTQHKLSVHDRGLYLKALETWNTALGATVLEYGGDKDVPFDVDNGATVVYHTDNVGGDNSDAVGRAWYRRLADGTVGKTIHCDVQIDYTHFFGCSQQGDGSTICQSNPTTFVQVLAHELGHCIGVKHNSKANSLMHPTAMNNNQSLLTNDINSAAWALGMKRPGGGGGN